MRNMSDVELAHARNDGASERERLLNLLLEAHAQRRQATENIVPRGTWDGPIPLSYAQERLWFLDQLGVVGAAYNVPMALRLEGSLNVHALERSFAELVRRHEILRTRFGMRDGVPHQVIDAPATFKLNQVDLSHIVDPEQREQQLRECARREQLHQFDLSSGSLLRVVVVRLGAADHALLITMHHIVADGWSLGIFRRELGALYGAYSHGQPSPLPVLPIQYADYAIWQRAWLQGEALENQLRYWRGRLLGAPPQLELPTDRSRPTVESFKGATLSVELPQTLSAALKELGRREGATLFMVFLAAYQILLSRWSGQQDVVVGTPIAGRTNRQIEGLIGFFVNTLVLRTDVSKDLTFRQLLQRVKDVTLGAYAHQDLPFEALVKELRPERSLTRQPIFQVALSLRNYPDERLELPGLTWTWNAVDGATAHFDLMLYLQEHSDGLSGLFEYATDLFDPETVARMAGSLRGLLEQIVADPNLRIQQLSLLTETERQQVIELFNATSSAYPREKVIHELFEEQVSRTPDAVAVEYEREALTYSELNRRANQLARYLRNENVGPDEPVAIFVERGLTMIVGLLGILKAGGAYVPLDPSYPSERLQYMIADAAPRVVVTQEKLVERLHDTQAELVVLDAKSKVMEAYAEENLSVTESGLNAENLVYLIYTSGSTGRPKGTAMTHRSMVNLIEWHRGDLNSTGQRVLQFAALSFDVAFQEIFSVLCAGGTLVLLDEWVRRDARALLQLLRNRSIERLFVPPLMLQSLAECFKNTGVAPSSLKDVITAGEQLRVTSDVVQFFEQLDGCRLHNHYGPTETHVVTALTLTGNPSKWPSLPGIGRPISNAEIYVLDEQLRPVPIGVAGEIYIGGAGVARGYFKRPDVTAERFIADPFSSDHRARLYKTGDLGRWRADATLEYLGRNDDQVKIRGYRVELGEIETHLQRHEHVKEAAVVVREGLPGEKQLVAYVTVRSEIVPGAEELRSHLKRLLPEYMVPSAFVILERLPLTPSGKLDRRALPAPDLAAYVSGQYEAPQGEVEETLARIWQDLLRVERVGRQNNFFELGGHSLLLVQMMERLRQVGLSAKVRSVYESPTLAALARTLAEETINEVEVPPNLIPPNCEAITPEMLPLVELEVEQIDHIVKAVRGGAENIQDIYPLAPLQEGMLFHHLLNQQGGDTYVVPILLSLPSREKLSDFIRSLQCVIDRHDVLRTAVMWEQLPKPVQVVYRRASLPVEELVLDRQRDPIEQLKERMSPEHQRLDVREAPLVRMQVAAAPNGEQWYAVLQLHHMICDHESLDTMLAEVVAYMNGRAQGLPQPLPYRNHVAQALAHAGTVNVETFFRSKFAEIDEPTAPFGLLDVHGDGSRIERAERALAPALSYRIRAHARQLGVSAATLFHVAWGLVVSHTSGRDDVVFGTVLLGRLQGSAGAHRILGMFMNTLPLRLRLRGLTAAESVKQTQRELVDLLSHEQASLAVAQRCSGVDGSAPLFTTLLNYRWSTIDLKSEFASAGVTRLAIQSHTNYPITVSVLDKDDGFIVHVQTDRRVDPLRVMEYTTTALQSLVEALDQAPQTPADTLSILPTAERHRLIDAFNATHAAFPADKLVHELFEDQTQRTPDAVAVVCDEGHVTYAELNRRANQLAHYLSMRGMRAGEYIPILMPRSLQMLIAQLAVLKCGGAYVPLDPSLPQDRLAFMLRDCGARMILAPHRGGMAPEQEAVQWIDCAEVAGALRDLPDGNLNLRMDAPPPAYVMYTSGSTGVPKGVIVPHRAICRLVINNGYARIEPTDCVAHCSNPAFDASTFEVWAALLHGARVLIVPQAIVLDPKHFADVLKQEHVTVLWLTVGLLAQYTGALGAVFGQLRYLITGGDVVEPGMMRRILQGNPPQHLLSAYGPTECTTFTTTHLVEGLDENTQMIPIGRPISNTQVYILDRHMQPVPVGVEGEIYVGGAGVALGYLSRPELTAERFIADPFSSEASARLYKSGDLGRWRADGAIEFLGRNDQQVKLRGFRVELGEIEALLARHSQVKDAVVTVRDDGTTGKRLVAYVTPRDGVDPTADALRAHLEVLLPEYMIPAAFVVLESLPLNANGKVDRRALPAPEVGAYALERYEAPEGEAERILAGLWQDLLSVERVGRGDNFFNLGGHSLLVLKALFEINRSFDCALSVRDVYRHPTLRELAARISSGGAEEEFVDLSREAMLDDEIVAISGSRCRPVQNVLLTGGTGFLGRFLLAHLLTNTDATIHCLVRAQSAHDALSRLGTTLSKWDLWRDEFARRIVAIPGDLRLPRLGIDQHTYSFLSQTLDTIYHCGTSMNHLETYAMAKLANVESTRELLKLATSRKPKLINYISTLSTFASSSTDLTRVVDESSPIEYERHSTANGYAASKWVSEKMFMNARDRGIPCNVFRMGLMWADTQEGRYDELQREYRVFKSCLLSGWGIKNYRYSLPPTPVDYAARAVAFLADQHHDGHGIFHISSHSQLDGVFERYNDIADSPLKLISFYDWICEMKQLHRQGRTLPIVPLIEAFFSMDEKSFYERQRRATSANTSFDCTRTSSELARAGIVEPALSTDLLRRYVDGMFSRDADLRGLMDRRKVSRP